MNYVVAVSGGVDSVVLLDMLGKMPQHDIVVAHVDHGIRLESGDDARFVEALAGQYGLKFVSCRYELGQGASEDQARVARYAFLRHIADKHQAVLVTAHHQDDIIDTIAINLTRGTGWRGLAVLGDASIERPLLSWTKQNVYDYALRHGLEWVEDQTNQTSVYLRNRLRRRTSRLSPASRHRLLELHTLQRELAKIIDSEAERHASTSRYLMTVIDDVVAIELLRTLLARSGASLTRPQRQRLLLAIKTARPGSTYQAGSGINIRFGLRDFIVKYPL